LGQRTCLIINENSGTHEQAALLEEAVGQREQIVCRTNSEAGQGAEMAREAVREGFTRIGAAGGDGTAHEVANGLVQAREALGAAPGKEKPEVAFGVVPLGTGNDLAATLALPEDPRDAVAILMRQKPRALDLLRITGELDNPVTSEYEPLYGLNAAAGGFTGEIDEAVTTELKKTWGPLAYLVGTARALPDLHEYDTHVAFDDDESEEIDAANVVIANGRTIGGGKRVAPPANPCDGLLDVVIVRWGRMVDFATVGARLVAGTWLQSPYVLHHRARKVRVASDPGMWFNVDGELQTKEPLTFEILPGALPVVVGPAFQAEPES
jgi:diacylglycerol kinase (ATP)